MWKGSLDNLTFTMLEMYGETASNLRSLCKRMIQHEKREV